MTNRESQEQPTPSNSAVRWTEHVPLAYQSLSADRPIALFSLEQNLYVRIKLVSLEFGYLWNAPVFSFSHRIITLSEPNQIKRILYSLGYTPIYWTKKLDNLEFFRSSLLPFKGQVCKLFIPDILYNYNNYMFLRCNCAKSLIKKNCVHFCLSLTNVLDYLRKIFLII